METYFKAPIHLISSIDDENKTLRKNQDIIHATSQKNLSAPK